MGRVGGCGLAGMVTYISTNKVGARETNIPVSPLRTGMRPEGLGSERSSTSDRMDPMVGTTIHVTYFSTNQCASVKASATKERSQLGRKGQGLRQEREEK